MIVGIPDEDVPNGTDEEVFSYYGMDVPGIVLKVKELIEKRNRDSQTANNSQATVPYREN